MANLILISGANGSGKSVFAEHLIAQTVGNRYYLATMQPCTEENERRIAKHKVQRRNLQFQTLEVPDRVGAIPLRKDSIVLLEDVSNLLANVLFEKRGDADYVIRDILQLSKQCRILVVVTITGLQAEGYDTETAAYIRSLEQVNEQLLKYAAVAITIQQKIPVYQKGDKDVLTRILTGGVVHL